MYYTKKINLIISIIILFTILVSLSTPIFATESNNITTRNLAMFATIAYADLENINNYITSPDSDINSLTFKNHNMVTDTELSSLTSSTVLLGINLSGQVEDTYSYLFYNLASTNEISDWKLINYTKINTYNIMRKGAMFTAMTFKRNNDIVIAYRGTDFDDIGDWAQDIQYGIIGRSGQEELAREYGVKIAETFPNCNIYVTGHSLGGYLAQIGGAAILESPYKNNVNEIGYFNGMGLYFWSNTREYLYQAKLISKETYNILTNPCTPYNYTQSSAQSTLTNWYNNGGKLVSYYIKGDVISSLGTHYGKKIGFNPAQACINHHKHTDISLENRHLNNLYKSLNNLKNRLNLNILQKDGVDLIDKITHFASELLFNNNLSSYVDLYSPDTLIGYIWITHETDSFFAVEEEKLDIHFNTPSTIKNRKCSTATLIVETGTSELISSKLTTSNISLSSLGNRRIQIISISDPVHSQDENGNNTYTYTINLKGKALIGNTRLILNANSLKTNTNSNIRIVSNYIRTKLI